MEKNFLLVQEKKHFMKFLLVLQLAKKMANCHNCGFIHVKLNKKK